jgi:hypothetical protein
MLFSEQSEDFLYPTHFIVRAWNEHDSVLLYVLVFSRQEFGFWLAGGGN